MFKQAAGGSPSMPEISLGKQAPAGQQEKSTLEARFLCPSSSLCRPSKR